MVTLLRWFKENLLKADPRKFQLMIIGKTPGQPIIFNINQIKRKESQKVVQMGVITDNLLYFQDHIDILCSTANYKIHGLRKMKEMFHSGKNKINAIQCIYK